MAHTDFSIAITDKAIDVRYIPSEDEPRGKLFGFIFIVSMLIIMNATLLLIPDKGSSMWLDMKHADFASSGFLAPLTILLVGTSFMSWVGSRYARAAWASDETFHCDPEVIIISRIPWLDFSNRTWRTYTYPLTAVRGIRFAVIASAKGRSFWGLRFKAPGRKWALPGLEAPEAKTILAGLKALGADVPDDPNLEKRIKETLENRGGTGWMDTSWMDGDKHN